MGSGVGRRGLKREKPARKRDSRGRPPEGKKPRRAERGPRQGPTGCCISHALASVTLPAPLIPVHPVPSFPGARTHRDGLNTFHVGIFNFMAANYSVALRSPCEGKRASEWVDERAGAVSERTNSPRHFTRYARVRPLRRDKAASSSADISLAPSFPLTALSRPCDTRICYGFFDSTANSGRVELYLGQIELPDSINCIYRSETAVTKLCETCD